MPLHHYLPASYISRFSDDVETYPLRDRVVSVGDKKNQKCFRGKAGKVGCIHNLYTLADDSSNAEIVDQVWADYEQSLPSAVDSLIGGTLTAHDWLRVLVPFVACMLVRGPDFRERMNGRSLYARMHMGMDAVGGDEANGLRLMELQRLLTGVLSAHWLVLVASGGEHLITNDLGYAPFVEPECGKRGIAIPLGADHVLGIIPAMDNRPILQARNNAWIPLIEKRQLLAGNERSLNRVLGKAALRFVFGPTDESCREAIHGIGPKTRGPEPQELGFPYELLRPSFEFTWHRLTAAVNKAPSVSDGWDFPMALKELQKGWIPPVLVPGNLVEFPPPLERTGETINLKFYDPEVYYDISMAEMGIRIGEFEVALRAASDAVQHASGAQVMARALNLRGGLRMDTDRLAEGVPDLEEAVSLDPRNAQYHTELAHALVRVGRVEDALRVSSRAITLDPGSGWALAARGEARWLSGNRNGGMADFRAALRLLENGNARGAVLSLRGTHLQELRQHKKAIADFQEAADNIQDIQRSSACLCRAALSREALGESDRALELLNRAIEMDERNARARMLRAPLLWAQLNADGAMKDLDDAVSLADDADEKVELLRSSGVILSEFGAFSEANGKFRAALALAPDNQSVLYDQSICFLSQGAIKEAIVVSEKLLKTSGADARVYNTLGNAHAVQGRHTDAVAAYRAGLQVVNKGLTPAKLQRNLAISLAALAESTGASAALAAAKKLDPRSPRNRVAELRIAFLGHAYEKAERLCGALPVAARVFAAPSLLALGKVKPALKAIHDWLNTQPIPVDVMLLLADLETLKRELPDAMGLDEAIKAVSATTRSSQNP